MLTFGSGMVCFKTYLTKASNRGGVSEREINIALVVKKSSPLIVWWASMRIIGWMKTTIEFIGVIVRSKVDRGHSWLYS